MRSAPRAAGATPFDMPFDCKLLWCPLLAAHAFAAVSNVRVAGVTGTQAILIYTVTQGAQCTLEVSESPSFAPLVHDVDPALFPDGNTENRAGNLSAGDERVFVIGRRASDVAADGKRYSRALQLNTAHYYRLACGADIITGTFRTANIPLGNTYNDVLPVDPAAPGRYSWPTFDGTSRNQLPGYITREAHVDPLTGALVRRITVPGDVIESAPLNVSFESNAVVRQADGGSDWRDPQNAAADDSRSAVFSGANSNWLLLRSNSVWFPANQSLDDVRVTIKGSGTADAPGDCTLQVCLTVNGVSCATRMQDIVLGSDERQFTVPESANGMGGSWADTGLADLTRDLVVTRTGTVSTTADASGSLVTWQSGDRFPSFWAAGSTIAIAGVEYPIAAVIDGGTLRLTRNAGAQAKAAYAAPNFGILVRKKTASTDAVSLQYAEYTLTSSVAPVWAPSGSADICATTPVNDASGQAGYYCMIPYPGGTRHLYWINRANAESHYLGLVYPPGIGGPDGFSSVNCGSAGATFDTADPHVFYCDATTAQGEPRSMIVKVTYRDASNAARPGTSKIPVCGGSTGAGPCFVLEPLTPASQQKDLESLVKLFDPAFPIDDFACSVGGLQSNYVVLVCGSGAQDTIGWIALYDVTKDLSRLDVSNPATYANNPIVAATDSYARPYRRWCTEHSVNYVKGSGNLMAVTSQQGYAGSGSVGQKGYGPWRSVVTGGNLSLNFEACPANGVDASLAGQPRCTTVIVDGEPCDPNPASSAPGTLSVTSNSTNVRSPGAGWGRTRWVDTLIAGTHYRMRVSGPETAELDRPYNGPTGNAPYRMFFEAANCPAPGRQLEHWLQDTKEGEILTINEDEAVRLIKKNAGNRWVLQRGYRQKFYPARDYTGQQAALYCPCEAWNHDLNYPTVPDWWWDFRMDPHGNGSGILLDPGPISHGSYGKSVTVGDTTWSQSPYPMSYTVRSADTLDSVGRIFKLNGNAPFSGKLGIGYFNSVESHVSWHQVGAPAGEKNWFIDMRPFLATPGTDDNLLAQRLNGSAQLYKITSNVKGEAIPLTRKHLPTLASCGASVLYDISSSATGDVIGDGPGDAYKYCVANSPGECRRGSAAGDVYVNCPGATPGDPKYPNAVTCTAGTAGTDICLINNGATVGTLSQMGTVAEDPAGAMHRVLTQTFQRYGEYDFFWNANILADASWILFHTNSVMPGRPEVLAVKVPPFPDPDGTNRAEFIPVTLSVQAPDGMAVDSAVVEFGYDERLFCTSRQEICVAASGASTIDRDNPFFFASENYAGAPCSGGCTVAVPALSQRILYYRVRYRDSDGKDLGTSAMYVTAVP